MTPSEAAFEAIVERYRLQLVKYAATIVGRDCADDVVQEALVCAHTALRRGDEVGCLQAWLYRIVRNKALNLVRDRGPSGVPLDESHAALDTPELATERKQALRRVVDAVHALPLKQRDAIVLRELEGRSYGEIAGQLGVSDPAVRGLLNRARVTLRRAAAALAPVWPSRLAELWSAGAIGGSGATRACATGLVATVATFGGMPTVRDREPEPSPAKAATTTPTEPTRSAPTPRARVGAVDRQDVVAADEPATATRPTASDESVAVEEAEGETPALQDEPEAPPAQPRDAPQHRERQEQSAPSPEARRLEPRMEVAQREPLADGGLHKTDVGFRDRDGMRRDFSR